MTSVQRTRARSIKRFAKRFTTQEACARRLGISAAYLSQMISGARPISEKTAHKLARHIHGII